MSGCVLRLRDGAADVFLGRADGPRQGHPQGQCGRDRRRVGAACAVRADSADERRRKQQFLRAVVKNVHRISQALQVPSLNQRGAPVCFKILRAAVRRSSGSLISISEIISASCRFGMTRLASGRSLSRDVTAAGLSSRAPLVATITGSTTNAVRSAADSRQSRTTRMISPE